MTFHRLRNTNVQDGISIVIELPNALFECIFSKSSKRQMNTLGCKDKEWGDKCH
jgi:hypothetical protein